MSSLESESLGNKEYILMNEDGDHVVLKYEDVDVSEKKHMCRKITHASMEEVEI